LNTQISIFRREGVDIRVVMQDGEPWFVATDVLTALGLDRTAFRRLDTDDKGVASIHTPGGMQDVVTVNEPGLYMLVLGSRKPSARDFKHWVTHEVLPAIRRTGSYTQDVQNALPQSYGEALRMLADEVETRAALEAKVAVDEPKVAYVDEFVTHDDVILFRVAANELGIHEAELRDRLVEARWIYKTLIGTRWSKSRAREVREFEYRAAAAHADKFRSMPQHNAPRHHNGQVRTTLYIRSSALPAIGRRVTSNLQAVTA
jgi:prophage antirepressor-like protein